jgi:NDP-sugar pyrophosphorylase family protein
MFAQSPSFSKKGEKFNVIILASGLGLRLRPETESVPKPMLWLGPQVPIAIDYLIQKFQGVAERMIIATAYQADLLEYYLKGKYGSLPLVFSREEVLDLKSPGRSVVFALSKVALDLPTIVMFSDFIIEDNIPVDEDALCLNEKPVPPYIIDPHTKGLPIIKDGVITGLIFNPKHQEEHYGGFTGTGIFHNTKLFKSIADRLIKEKPDVAYDFDIVEEYISQVRTVPVYISKIYEFGTPELLKQMREKNKKDADNLKSNN